MFINFFKGILIGVALVIPGLSGSIFAVITGLYDKIIYSINNIKTDSKNQFLFLFPIGVGILVGILLSTKLVLHLCFKYPIFSYSFFIGLVLGSIPFIINKIKPIKINIINVLICLLGFLFIYYLGNLDTNKNSQYIAIETIHSFRDFLKIFFAGAFSCSLMTIPGVSGSILLMVINQYGTVYNSISKISDFVNSLIKLDFYNAFIYLKNVLVILPFILGAFIGIILIAKLLGIILKKYQNQLFVMVIGIMFAAIFILFSQGIYINLNLFYEGFGFFINFIFCILFLIIGFFTSKFCE